MCGALSTAIRHPLGVALRALIPDGAPGGALLAVVRLSPGGAAIREALDEALGDALVEAVMCDARGDGPCATLIAVTQVPLTTRQVLDERALQETTYGFSDTAFYKHLLSSVCHWGKKENKALVRVGH